MKWATVVAVGLAGCASAPRSTLPGAADARQTVLAFVAALNALDLAGLASHLADDVTAFVPTASGQRLEGKTAVMDVLRGYVEANRQAPPRIEPRDLVLSPLGETAALATFHVRGAASLARRSFVLRRHGGRWLIIHFHASNAPLP